MALTEIRYSPRFEAAIRRMHRGMEDRPQYAYYIAGQLSGPKSRLAECEGQLLPEIEHHLGPLEGRRALDFGCGTGITTACLAGRGARVVALDIREESLEIARQRVGEHGLHERVEEFACGALEELAPDLGRFDLILLNGVIEHIPLSIDGARRGVLRQLFELLEVGGCLFIGDTPNRLLPFDGHTTHLWWIPWTRPGSEWAYRRAIAKGRFLPAETYSEGTLGLEEEGAWGATYWEILSYLDRGRFEVVNLLSGHDESLHFAIPRSGKRALFERLLHPIAVRTFGVPLLAFFPFLSNLVIRRTA